jgi:uncharacterized protein (DUF433 family)
MINWRNYIESDPSVLYGKPVIKGTRIPIDLILEKLSEGETIEDLLLAYPRIDKETIFAIFAFAAFSIKNEVVYSLAS